MMTTKTKFFGKCGLAALAATAFLPSLACSADFACGGLFLLNDYSLKVGEHKFSASVEYSRYHLTYGDDWDLDIGSYGFPGNDGSKGNGSGSLVGSFAYQSDYKFLTLGASVDTRPWVTATMTLHAADSLFYVGTELGRGDLDIARVKWAYNKSDMVPDISADWESHILNKGLSLGFKARGHRLDLAGNYYKSTPFNRSEKYFIRDSLNIWNLSGRYSWGRNDRFGDRVEKFSVGYRYINGDITLYGIRSQDGDTKRFMYTPVSGSVHVADVKWNDVIGTFAGNDDAAGSASAAGSLDFNALAIYAQGHLDNDGKRFHETLAPNRALQTSVLQALSFNFLQMNYRVDADAEGGLGLAGLAYHKTFGNSAGDAKNVPAERTFAIEPRIAANFYYAKASADAELTSETTQLIITKKEVENNSWDVTSIGAIAALGVRLAYGPFHFDANAYQLIPFTAEVDDHKPKPELPVDPDQPVKPSTKKDESYAFGNGLFCTLNIGFNF